MRPVTIFAVAGLIASAWAGCSSSSTNPDTGGAGGVDAGPRCNPSAQFLPAKKVAELSGLFVVNARPTESEHEAYLGIVSTSAWIAYSSRKDVKAGFGAPTPLPNPPSGDNTSPAPSPDGQHMVFAHQDTPKGYHLWTTDLGKAGFSNPQPLTQLDDPDAGVSQQSSFVAARSQNLYYTTDASGQFDIWVSHYENGKYQPGAPVPGLESPFHEGSPVVTGDERTIYFGSNRLDADAGTAPSDIFVATFDDASGKFGTPTPVDELNSVSREYPTWVSDDGCVLYFLSNRDNVDLRFDVYRTEKP